MSELTEALIAIAKGGCECEVDECDGTCGPSIAERAAKHIAELECERCVEAREILKKGGA